MIATGKRSIENGKRYDHLFDRPIGKDILKKRDARVSDTVSLMQQAIRETRQDTLKIAKVLKRSSVRKTAKAIWDFCFNHFQYTQDAAGREQVRRPSRSWADRFSGIDCDCFTVFIGSVLYNLQIPFLIRLARYHKDQFEHVYPVALDKNQNEIIIDCVVHAFDYEANYTQKKDIEMDLEYLNGVPHERYNEFGDLIRFNNDLPIDAEDLFLDEMELEGLEGRAERQARRATRQAKRKDKKAVRKANNEAIKQLPTNERIKARLKQGLNVVNKVNPATALLRAGVLASMKLNLFNVASKLRFGYWTEAEAIRNNMDIGKFRQLKQIMTKMEKVYYGAGGNPAKLKEAILTGKGNRNRMVGLNGLGAIALYEDEDDLHVILGSELIEEVETPSLSGLGEVTTATAIASASGLIGVIAGLLKKLGVLFKSGTPQADQEMIQENTDLQEEQKRKFSFDKMRSNIERFNSKVAQFRSNGSTASDTPMLKSGVTDPMDDFSGEEDFSPDANYQDDFRTKDFNADSFAQGASKDATPDKPKGGFGTWVKENPVMAGAIGLAILGGGVYAIHAVKKSKGKSLNGVPKRKTKSTLRKKTTRKSKPSTKGRTQRTTSKRTTRKPTRRKPATKTVRAITLK